MMNNNYLLQVFKVSGIPSLIIKPDAPVFTIVEVNDAYLKATNTTSNDLIAKGIFEAFPDNPDDKTADGVFNLRQSLLTVISTSKPHKMAVQKYDIPIRETTQFEEKYWTPENIPVLDEDNKAAYIIHTVVDVTEEVKLNQLIPTKANMEALINGTEDLIWSVDRNLRLLTCNNAFLKMMVTVTGNIPKQGDSLFAKEFGSEINEAWKQHYQRALAGEKFTLKTTDLYNPATRSAQHRLITCNPMKNEASILLGVACHSKDVTEDTINQQALEKVKNELDKIMDSSLDVICTINEAGKFVNVSAASEKIWGYKPEELIGTPTLAIVHEEDYDKTKAARDRMQSGADMFYFENRYVRKDGSIVPLAWSATWDAEKKTTYCVGRDNTEKLKAEALLANSQKRYRALVENSGDAVVVLNPDGKATYVTPSIERVLGYTEAEAIRLQMYEILHPDDRKRVSQIMLECMQKPGIPIQGPPARTRHKDGRWIWIEATITNMLHEPSINGIVDNFRDITDRITAAENLQHSEQKYKELFQFSPLPQFIYQLNSYQILHVNETAIQHYGFSREEFIGITVKDIRPPEDVPMLLALHKDIKNKEGIISFGISNHIKKDKSLIKTEVSGYRLSYQNRDCMMVVCNDVTERENALQQLKEKDEKLETAQKIARLGYWQLKAEDKSVYWSDEAFNIWEVAKGSVEVTYEYFLSSIHRDDKHLFEIREAASFTGEDEPNFEFRIILPNGTLKWLHAKGKLLQDKQLGSFFLEGTVQDITEQKLLSLSLEQSNQRFNYATKATSDAIWDWDLVKGSLYWGEGFQHIFGYKIKDLPPTINSWTDHIHPEDLERVVNGVYEMIDSRDTNWTDEYRYQKADGMYAYVADKGLVIRDEKGKAIRMVGAMQDITSRKQQQEHLKLLELVITSTTDAVVIAEIKMDGERPIPAIVYVNDAFTRITGYTAGEVMGKQPRLFLQGPKSDKAAIQRLDEALRNQQPCEITSISYKKNGEEYWINSSVSPVIDEKGFLKHWIAVQRDVTEQVKAQEEIANQKKFTEDILNNIPSDIAVFDSKHNYIFLNPNAIGNAEIREWMIGKNDFDYCARKGIGNETAIKRRELFNNTVEHKAVIEWVDEHQPHDGETKFILRKFYPYFEYGMLKYVIGYGTDITERKMAEMALAKALEEKNTILESIGDAFFAVDKDWVVTYWNNLAETALMKPKSEILGHNLWSVFSRSIGSDSYNKYYEAIETNQVIHFETYYDISGKWYEVSAYPSSNGLSVYFKDITERKLIDQRISTERNLLRTLIDNLPDTVYFKDKSARKLISNSFDYKVLGAATEKEVLGKTDLQLMPHEAGLACYNHDLEILRTGKPLLNLEEYFTPKDMKPLWLLTTKLPLYNEQKEIIGLLGIGRDITERKIADEKLKELNSQLEKHVKQLEMSNAELEQFAYVASHDLQEPLRMVTSFLTQLEKKYGQLIDDKGKQYIGFAVDGAKRMRQIILDLLEFSKAGMAEDKIEEVDLNEVIKDTLFLYRKQIQDKKAVVAAGKLPKVKTFRAPIRQVFQNLISNSLKYQQEGKAPRIIISAKASKTHWQFSVADNGIGIDPQYFDKIFIIFQRLHNKSAYSGTGMGLAITKKIIDNAGGRIWVESEEGKGSTFYFNILKK